MGWIRGHPKQHLLMNFSKIAPIVFPETWLLSLKHVAIHFELATMATKMATQWSQSNQSVAIGNNTLLMIFSQIGPLGFPKHFYETKTCC